MLIRPKPSRILLLLTMFVLPVFVVVPQGDWDTIAAERHYKRGQKLYRDGQTEQAIEELYTALSVREIYFDAQLLLGRSLIDAKRYREAAMILREIEPPDNGAAEVHKLLGKAHYEMNRLREAARNLQYAIGFSRRPDYELHYLLGLVMLRQGDGEGAIAEARRAVTLKPRFAPARKLLSDAYLMKKDYRRSVKALERYLASARDHTETAGIKERIDAIKNLGEARPGKSVKEPITLPRIYRIPRPGYTLEALRYKVEGSVRLEVLFSSDGAVKHAIVACGLGFGLDEAALNAARGIEFKPGEVGGKPVSMWMGVSILFGPIEIESKQEEPTKIALINGEPLTTIDSSQAVRLSSRPLTRMEQEGS
jgi:TonB family protein